MPRADAKVTSMSDQDYPIKTTVRTARITVWTVQGLLIVGILFLIIGSRGGPAWMRGAGALALAAVLFMPTLLLMLQPNLAIMLINAFLNLLGRRHTPSGVPIEAYPPSNVAQWDEMSNMEKTSVYLIALIGAALSAAILCYLMMPRSS
jgi:hypothetical protein